MAQGMYTPERSPTISIRARGQHSASSLLYDEEHGGKDALKIDDERSSEHDSPTPDGLVATQKIEEEKVVSALNMSLNINH